MIDRTCAVARTPVAAMVRSLTLSIALLGSHVVPAAATPALDYLFVVTSDYSVSGQVSTVDVLAPWSVDQNLASVHSDAVAREHGGLVYIVNRLYQDNIQVLDPSQDFETIRQFSVGPGSNPQDIVFASPTRAYVSRYEETSLYEVDPTTGAVTDSIDLSAFADDDGIPEMGQMAVWGGRLFVGIQRLDRDYFWLPEPPSYLVVIDTDTNEFVDVDPEEPGVQGIALSATNPSTEILVDADVLYVGAAGKWGVLDGGIEAIDPASLSSLGFVTTEAELGGEINDFTPPVGGRAHAVVSISSPSWEAFCISFDWETGEKIQDVWRPGGFDVTDVEAHAGAGELFVSDRTYTNPGVRIFDVTDDSQLTSSPLDVGLPPHDLLVIGDEIVGVPEDGVSSGSAFDLAVSPNPCRSVVSVDLTLPSQGHCSIGVYDVAGRRVADVHSGRLPAGRSRVRWEGADASGRPVASGIYFVRLVSGGLCETAKALLLR